MLSICNNLLRRNRQHISSVLQKGIATSSIDNEKFQHITVLGGGVMGAGIAQLNAQNGFDVTVVDSDEYVQKCLVSIIRSLNIIAGKKFPDEKKAQKKFIDDTLSHIKTTQKLEEGCVNSDLVIESVIEDLDIKRNLFQRIDEVSPEKTIFASNTSSLRIKDIAAATKRPDRFIGLHFFNPVWHMKLVEVVETKDASKVVVDAASSYVTDLGKMAVKCSDNHGFIVNSLLYPYLLNALRFLEEGHASVKDIDTAMKLGAGLPSGPFELIDIIGIDTVKNVLDHWHKEFPDDPKYFPSKTLDDMAAAMKLGMKTKQGFYSYKHKLF